MKIDTCICWIDILKMGNVTCAHIKCFICYIGIRPFDTINLHSAEDRSNVTRLYSECNSVLRFFYHLHLLYASNCLLHFLSRGLRLISWKYLVKYIYS